MDINLKELNMHIDEFKEGGKEPKKLVIWYKTYLDLMTDDQFVSRITGDKKDLMIRNYRGIRIKMVTEKYYFEIE